MGNIHGVWCFNCCGACRNQNSKCIGSIHLFGTERRNYVVVQKLEALGFAIFNLRNMQWVAAWLLGICEYCNA
nr:hypothetical protein Iba_chr05fCG5180 [Ipomoea batatas]